MAARHELPHARLAAYLRRFAEKGLVDLAPAPPLRRLGGIGA